MSELDIKFIELLPRTGTYWKGLFEVNKDKIEVGITDTLLAVWKVQINEKTISLLLKQVGSLQIQLMLAEGKTEDHMLQTYSFTKGDGKTMTIGEAIDYLQKRIMELEDNK